MEAREQTHINSIVRAIAILELFGRSNERYLGITEICKMTGLQKTTVFNIVKTLVHTGWLVQDIPNGKYKLGTRILRVSTQVAKSITTEDIILQEMHRLRDLYNEDVVLTGMIDGVPVCIEKVQSANVLRIQSKVGRVSSLLKGSTGKTLFAWQSPEFIQTTLNQSFPNTPEGHQERETLEASLQQIRTNGYCITIGEQDPGVASVTVPILNKEGIARYSLSVIGEENRVRQKGMEIIRCELLATARRVETEQQLLLPES